VNLYYSLRSNVILSSNVNFKSIKVLITKNETRKESVLSSNVILNSNVDLKSNKNLTTRNKTHNGCVLSSNVILSSNVDPGSINHPITRDNTQTLYYQTRCVAVLLSTRNPQSRWFVVTVVKKENKCDFEVDTGFDNEEVDKVLDS